MTSSASGISSSGRSSNSTTVSTALARGARGDHVASLQRALISADVTVRGGADGVFGPATETALRTFQTSVGLPATR
ncbi:MAG: peptidoglycan-binding domain-containing protein [Ilumatobacteraceae bacterium]